MEIVRWKKHDPAKQLFVCLTGTDLHVDLKGSANSRARGLATQSLYLADRVILLEPEGIRCLPSQSLKREVQKKVAVIYQSARPVKNPPSPLKSRFEVSVIGHLRKVKDPFLAAKALKYLPQESKIHVVHFGQALEPRIERDVEKYQRSATRYSWLGPRPHGETMRRLARSRLTLLTSRVEGAPSVISEAIVNEVPVISTRIPASEGLLGKKYPGLFPVGDEERLARLLVQAETDPAFLRQLQRWTKKLRPRFTYEAEVKCWKKLLNENLKT